MVCPRQFYSWQLAKSQVICQRQFHSWELSKIQAVCPRQLHFWNSLITMRFAQDTCKHITFLSYSWILTSQAFRIIAIGLPQSRSCILSAPSPPRGLSLKHAACTGLYQGRCLCLYTAGQLNKTCDL